MRTLLSLLFFFLYFNCILAQIKEANDKIDEINLLIKKGDSLNALQEHDNALNAYQMGLLVALDGKKEKLTSILYKKIGVYHHRKQDYPNAEENYRKGLQLDSLSNNAADLYFNISLIKNALRQYDSILPYLETSLELYDSFTLTKGAYNAYLNAGINYNERQLYNKALTYLIKSYNGYQKLNIKKKLADVCSVIGNVQDNLHNYNQALYYYKEALKLQNETNNVEGLGRTYTNMANTADNLKMYDSAVFYYKKSLKFLKPSSAGNATAKYNLADTYKSIGKTKLAENYFKESIKLNKTLKDTISFLYGYNGIISLYLEDKALKKAKKYLDSLSPLVLKVSDQIITLNFYENQADYYYKIKHLNKAFDYQLRHNELYKEIYNREQTEIVQNLQAKFEYTNKENEILKLKLTNKNNQLQLAEKNKSLRNKNILLLIFALLITAIIVSYYLYRARQENVKQQLKIEKLEAVYEGQETIKRRIARDLHDIITTNFDGLRLRILALKKSVNPNELIDEITTELKGVNQQIRVVSHRLAPLQMQIGNRKFTDIIRSRLSEFQLYSNVFVELEDQLPGSLNFSSTVVQNNFYGILLEILNNVQKHALATKLNIKYYIDDKESLNFIFLDNGIGIENNSKEGIGLLNIKQRCEIIDGQCQIEKVEFGTKVHIIFPLNKTSNSE